MYILSQCSSSSNVINTAVISLYQQGHRGSSTQIRTFALDGRTTTSAALHHLHAVQSTDSGSVAGTSQRRSPSPASCHRAASLDMRYSSPGGASFAFSGSTGYLQTPSPSQSSLTSLTFTGHGSVFSACNSPVPPQLPRGVGITSCLSPLLIPAVPSRPLASDPSARPASPLGAAQPDQYQHRDGPHSQTSGPSLGTLYLSLNYNINTSGLHIHLIEGEI